MGEDNRGRQGARQGARQGVRQQLAAGGLGHQRLGGEGAELYWVLPGRLGPSQVPPRSISGTANCGAMVMAASISRFQGPGLPACWAGCELSNRVSRQSDSSCKLNAIWISSDEAPLRHRSL